MWAGTPKLYPNPMDIVMFLTQKRDVVVFESRWSSLSMEFQIIVTLVGRGMRGGWKGVGYRLSRALNLGQEHFLPKWRPLSHQP